MPIFIPDLFTSYINGRRQAVADNWQDLSNYNHILAGQLNNAFNMATFDPRVRSTEAVAQSNEQANALGGAQTDQALAQIALQNKNGVPAANVQAQLAAYNFYKQYYDQLASNPLQYGAFMQLNNPNGTANGVINTGMPNLGNVPNANANANANANVQQPTSTNSK